MRMTILKPKPTKSLYIHIPFCEHICSYCDFPKLVGLEELKKSYLLMLFKELDRLLERSFKTVYVGGGTPTSLDYEDLKSLLLYINDRFLLEPDYEYSFETTIEELAEEKISLLKSFGVNRISIGVQTFNTKLPYLNRFANFKELEEKVRLLHKYGLTNYSFDLIYGFPGSDVSDLKQDLDLALSLEPQHISCYPLQIEENSILFHKGVEPLDEDQVADQYDFLVPYLKDRSYQRYEISNFAKKGFESKHNLAYWHQDNYEAAGLGAVSYLDGIRTTRTRSIALYNKGDYYESVIDESDDLLFDYLMLSLRLQEGFSLREFQERFGFNFKTRFKTELSQLQDAIIIDEERVRINEDCFFILNSILVTLLKTC